MKQLKRTMASSLLKTTQQVKQADANRSQIQTAQNAATRGVKTKTPARQTWYSLPKIPGFSGTSDLKKLKYNMAKYMQDAESPEPVVKQIQLVIDELSVEEQHLGDARKHINKKSSAADLALANRVAMKHAHKVSKLIQRFNLINGNKHKVTNYFYDPLARKTDFSQVPIVPGTPVLMQRGEDYHVGSVVSKMGEEFLVHDGIKKHYLPKESALS